MDAQEVFHELGGWDAFTPYLVAIFFLFLGFAVAQLFARTAEQVVRQKATPHTAAIARKLVFYAVFISVILVTLAQLGVQLSALLAAAGILTVALGFAAQTSVSNVISGIFLYFDRPFSINDTVKISEVIGTVTSIDLLSTRVRTFDNLMVRIPNETLLKSTITNFTLFDIRRIDIPVSVAYGTDLKACRKLLLNTIIGLPLILDEPAPVVLVDNLGDDGVELMVRVWIERTEFVQAKSGLTQSIYNALDEAGIEIPWPQRVIHMRTKSDLQKNMG